MYDVACSDFKTFEQYSQQIFTWMNAFIDYNNELDVEIVSQFSEDKLIPIYNEWYNKYLHWQTGIYFYFVLEPIVTDKLYSQLKEHLEKKNKGDELTHYTNVIMSPEKMTVVAEEQLKAITRALDIKKGKDKERVINVHYNEFLWIPCYDIKDDEYTIEFFNTRFEKLLKEDEKALQQMKKEIESDYDQRKKSFDQLMKSIDDEKLRDLSKIMHWLVYYKDYRDDLRRKAGFAGKRFMKILANKLDITLEEVNYLIHPEVVKSLQGGSIDIEEIRKRIPSNFVLLSTPGNIKLFTGDEAKKVIQKELENVEKDDDDKVYGVIASKNKAKGRVVIIRHTISLKNIKEGDVMVAVTTHPDYVPAMKKCNAIVTDEGGITSHAAIIARELNIPCIVGTKKATHIFKDGDEVEVDADQGFVKIIKKDL